MYPLSTGAAVPDSPPTAAGAGDLARAVAALTAPDLAAIVDFVAWLDAGWLYVANSEGSARLPVADADGPWEVRYGRDPLAAQDPMHGVPLAAALADPSPPNARNAYPFAGRRLLSAFGDPTRSPDLIVVHTPGHYWPERGGHLGEHGSLDAGQSRAPLLLSGAGVRVRGLRSGVARVIDVAPTLAALAGVTMPGAEGAALGDLVGPGARHVVGLLWDGTNSNDLLHLAAAGELPNVARLLAEGAALTGGAIAEFPSVTLTNHTSALTGLGPGRHGILHNVYFDREVGRQIIANDVRTWHVACDQLRDGVETLFEAIVRQRPDAVCACVNEPVDRGAHYSTFGLVRAAGSAGGAGDMGDYLPPAEGDPHASERWVRDNPDYAWSTRVDALGLAQVTQLWAADARPPDVMWWNTTLTDTGHHGGGPYSEQSRASLRDADARLGVFLDVLAERGLLSDTAFLLTADHGSEAADPACRGDWGDALRAADVTFRDEGYGFIYLGEQQQLTVAAGAAGTLSGNPAPATREPLAQSSATAGSAVSSGAGA
ncbi:alkaline phosphatase family protein [Frankia sp. AgB32]|uniref:alkaline phosphatase family protein n=1 Tax=Frankia sp. AgB32 TaxID=631119 RepID=UPI0027E236AB|nr:alkaline phosphatase family protein [Frankia sp. AgB32]